jgi:ankyrin repeat protein
MLAHATLVTALVAAGADVNARNNLGISAHMVAAESGNREPAAALLGAGADRGLREKRRAKAADIALVAGHAALVELLR